MMSDVFIPFSEHDIAWLMWIKIENAQAYSNIHIL